MTVILSLIIAIQLFYWYYFFGSLSSRPTSDPLNQETKPISIVICVKNEIENLRENLPYLLRQIPENQELVIANDFSTDATSDFLKKIDNERRTLIVHEVNQNKQGKKQALSEALSAAAHNNVLLTDADCRPATAEWLPSMQNQLRIEKIKIVLGYSPSEVNASFVSKWAHFETWMTAIQYLSYAARGLPYMGVGRNLLYDKTLIQQDTFAKYEHLSSGDDDLTIMQIATKENTAINLDKNSFVHTSAPETWGNYLSQKRRHYSTGTAYRLIHKVLLGIFSLSHILFYVALLVLLMQKQLLLAGLAYLLRLTLISPVIQKLRTTLSARFRLIEFLYLDIFLAFYYFFFSFAVLFPQKQKW